MKHPYKQHTETTYNNNKVAVVTVSWSHEVFGKGQMGEH